MVIKARVDIYTGHSPTNTPMKAAWDWDLPRESDEEEQSLVEFAAELGFDTLIVRDPSTVMLDRGHELGVAIVDIIGAEPTDAFASTHPGCLQSLHPVEEDIVEALEDAPDEYQQLTHRWFPLVHGVDRLCFEHEASLSFLEDRVSDALATADGIAFDGFGFQNHYACFCDGCITRRKQVAIDSDAHKYEILSRVSEEQLVEASERLYTHAKDEQSNSVVTNHVWPPLNPNPYYGHRLTLDYCTQTIAWFYRPNWSIDRVEFEAAEHIRLEGEANTFVPFIGMANEKYKRRSPARLERELEIAMEYGNGSLVLCPLGAPHTDPKYTDVVKGVLS